MFFIYHILPTLITRLTTTANLKLDPQSHASMYPSVIRGWVATGNRLREATQMRFSPHGGGSRDLPGPAGMCNPSRVSRVSIAGAANSPARHPDETMNHFFRFKGAALIPLPPLRMSMLQIP